MGLLGGVVETLHRVLDERGQPVRQMQEVGILVCAHALQLHGQDGSPQLGVRLLFERFRRLDQGKTTLVRVTGQDGRLQVEIALRK